MLSKTEAHQYYFEVQLDHKEGKTGILAAKDIPDTIEVATPPEFAGGVADAGLAGAVAGATNRARPAIDPSMRSG